MSPRYGIFLKERKDRAWAGPALLKSINTFLFIEKEAKAMELIDLCLSDDFKHAAQRPLCLYAKAQLLDDWQKEEEAIAGYQSFIEQYPKHEKAYLCRKRVDFLQHGY